jgi:hypothetical protein
MGRGRKQEQDRGDGGAWEKKGSMAALSRDDAWGKEIKGRRGAGIAGPAF